ncbi:MAG: hypothetical protein AB1442_12580, partial [Nitrospirota bacterium]
MTLKWLSALICVLLLLPIIPFPVNAATSPTDIPSGTAAETSGPVDKPLGTGKERVTEDVFGRKGGYIHPFLALTGFYTDNVFNTRDDEKGDFGAVISPGIWLSFPHVYEKLLKIETSNIS